MLRCIEQRVLLFLLASLFGHYYGVDAMMTAHVHSGWIIFIAIAGAIMYIIKRMEKKRA